MSFTLVFLYFIESDVTAGDAGVESHITAGDADVESDITAGDAGVECRLNVTLRTTATH